MPSVYGKSAHMMLSLFGLVTQVKLEQKTNSDHHTFCFLLRHSPQDVVVLSAREDRPTGGRVASDMVPSGRQV